MQKVGRGRKLHAPVGTTRATRACVLLGRKEQQQDQSDNKWRGPVTAVWVATVKTQDVRELVLVSGLLKFKTRGV